MKILSVFIFFVFGFTTFSQVMDTIEWREAYRLTWNDFKAAPDAGSDKKAITCGSILYQANSKGNTIECIAMCYFDRQRSWVKQGYALDYVLRHEQGHFDLYEIYARKIRKMLSEKKFKRKSLSADLKKILSKMISKANAMQNKYDNATSYSFKEANQKKWTQKISIELKELEKYKNSSTTLLVK